MKELALFLVLILVLGIGGFLYRNTMERPYQPAAFECQADARICPDGTSVGRTGAECSFTACPYPNREYSDLGLAFAIPVGYTEPDFTHPDLPLAAFTKPTASESVEHLIIVDVYPIPEGQTGDQVILANTRFQPADMPAEDFSRFQSITIAGRTYRWVVIERFEALVQSSYFLVREKDVLRFDITEHDVVNWTDPNLVVETLPEHQTLRRLLETLQTK